jgi:diguanylate cyclase (GGDEF)-like protein/PAS domain S-box-containing protein
VIEADSIDGLIEALPVALVGVDARGLIFAVNEEAHALLGYARGELLGQPVEMLVPEAARARHVEDRQAYLRAPAGRPMGAARDLTALRRDRTPLAVRISLKPVQTERGPVTLAGIVDNSAQKALELHLREQYQLMEKKVAERTADLEQRNREMVGLLEALEAARAELEHLSRVDPLTGLPNRREFDARAEGECRRADRRGSPPCVAMLDLDFFKSVNDRFGHRVGDDVLRRVAGILKGRCRADDLIARYGGEEFVVLLPETDAAQAWPIVDRMRSAVEDAEWTRLCPGLGLTLSAGLAVRRPAEPLQDLIDAADRRLYEAKAAGRNRVRPALAEATRGEVC